MSNPTLLVLVAAASLACQRAAREPQHALAQPAGAAVPPALGPDSLTPRQSCYIGIFEKQQLPGAECMIRCIRDGSGVGIGGGCWHICYAYTAVPMPSQGRFDACPDGGPEPVSPRAAVSCSAAPGRREVRVRLVDVNTRAPLRHGMAFHSGPGRSFVETDSLGVATFRLDATGPTVVTGSARGYVYARDTVAVGQDMICDVVMRLVSGRGHGF